MVGYNTSEKLSTLASSNWCLITKITQELTIQGKICLVMPVLCKVINASLFVLCVDIKYQLSLGNFSDRKV